MPETFLPSSKGESSFSSLGGGLVNNEGGGAREGKRGVNQSLGTQRASELLRLVTSVVLGRLCKNEPLLHLLEVSLLHAL